MPREKKVRHIIPISGKDSLCTAIVQMERAPKLPYEFVFCDVRMELPETYAWLNSVEKKLGIKITRIGKNLEAVIAEVGKLPSHLYRFCTLQTKIAPYQDYIEKDDASLIVNYIGFRFDEKDRIPKSGVERLSQARGNVKVEEVYPLVEEGVSVSDVYKILNGRDIAPPTFFWKRLYDEVYDRSGPVSQKFIENCPPWTRAYLFSWRSRSNCFQCHYQRLYEWVGLLEHHPDLFERAERMEEMYGGIRSEYRIEKHEEPLTATSDFYFHMGWPLRNIRKEADRIFETRVNAVYESVVDNRRKPLAMVDLLSTTSCGAYCGK